MKPTIENLRQVAGQLTNTHELSMMKDNIAFYITGVREAAGRLRRSVNEVESLLDKARAAEAYINDRIRILLGR